MKSRIALHAALHGNDIRSLQQQFGYKLEIDFDLAMHLYKSVGLAARGIDIWVDMTWRKPPYIKECEDNKTEPLIKAIKQLNKKHKIYTLAKRADRLSCIGRYSVIVINADGDIKEPLQKNSKLHGFVVYSEKQADVATWVNDDKDPRRGMPDTYKITPTDEDGKLSRSFHVHYSRVIHVIEDALESTIYGEPKLQSSYNTLYDIIKIMGSGAEMWFKGAYQGLAFSFDPDMNITDTQIQEFLDKVEEYQNNLKRTIGLSGMTVQQLSPSVADPRGNLEMQLDIYAAERKVPRRILMGSEQGQLASSTDRDMFLSAVDGRRETFAADNIIIPLFERLMEYGMLPQVDEWELGWPDLVEETADEKIQRAQRKFQILSQAKVAIDEGYTVLDEVREELKLSPEVPDTDFKPHGDYDTVYQGLPTPEYEDLQGNVVGYLPMKRQRKRRVS